MENEILENEELEEQVEIDPPKFAVRTTLNVDMQLEATDAVQGKGFHIFSYVCMGLCAVMMFATIVLYFIDKNSTNLVMAAFLALALAFLIYNKHSAPKKAMARWEQNLERSFGAKEIHLKTEFFEYSMFQTLEEDERSFSDSLYREISQFKETEHLFLLQCSKRQWYFVEKSGFKVGNPEEFKKFITERIGGK